MLRVAFVGCGNISSYHLDAIAAAAPVRATVTALVDPDSARSSALAAKVVEKLGGESPREFTSLAAALAADPEGELFDACDVMVPSWETEELGDLHEAVGVEVSGVGRRPRGLGSRGA